MEKITRATAIYSGGGIYLYYAELENGNWIMGSDDGLIVVDTNPLANDEVFEESGYWEWQEEHLVKFIQDGKEFDETLNKILETILCGKSIEEYDNFDEKELEYRYS